MRVASYVGSNTVDWLSTRVPSPEMARGRANCLDASAVLVGSARLRHRGTAEAAVATWVVGTGVTGTGSFLDGAKYFSSLLFGSRFLPGELGWVGAKPWWMQEFLIVGSGRGTWPAGCLFLGNRMRQDSGSG